MPIGVVAGWGRAANGRELGLHQRWHADGEGRLVAPVDERPRTERDRRGKREEGGALGSSAVAGQWPGWCRTCVGDASLSSSAPMFSARAHITRARDARPPPSERDSPSPLTSTKTAGRSSGAVASPVRTIMVRACGRSTMSTIASCRTRRICNTRCGPRSGIGGTSSTCHSIRIPAASILRSWR